MRLNWILQAACVAALAAPSVSEAGETACNMPKDGQGGLTILFDQINADRISRDLAPLRISAPLTIAAQMYACMLATPSGAAIGPNPADAMGQMKAAGCSSPVMDDTVVQGPITAMESFLAMHGHSDGRRTLLSQRANAIGLGVATPLTEGSTGAIWVVTVASNC